MTYAQIADLIRSLETDAVSSDVPTDMVGVVDVARGRVLAYMAGRNDHHYPRSVTDFVTNMSPVALLAFQALPTRKQWRVMYAHMFGK